jgi:hypothetical protein
MIDSWFLYEAQDMGTQQRQRIKHAVYYWVNRTTRREIGGASVTRRTLMRPCGNNSRTRLSGTPRTSGFEGF